MTVRIQERLWEGSHIEGYSPWGYIGDLRYCQWIIGRMAEETRRARLIVHVGKPGTCPMHGTLLVRLDDDPKITHHRAMYGCDECFDEQVRISVRLQDEFTQRRKSQPRTPWIRVMPKPRPPGDTFNCYHCGKLVKTKNRNQRYCSPACKKKAYQPRVRADATVYRGIVRQTKEEA